MRVIVSDVLDGQRRFGGDYLVVGKLGVKRKDQPQDPVRLFKSPAGCKFQVLAMQLLNRSAVVGYNLL